MPGGLFTKYTIHTSCSGKIVLHLGYARNINMNIYIYKHMYVHVHIYTECPERGAANSCRPLAHLAHLVHLVHLVQVVQVGQVGQVGQAGQVVPLEPKRLNQKCFQK